MLGVGHDGPHRDRAGDDRWVTPEITDAVTVSPLAHALTTAPGRAGVPLTALRRRAARPRDP
ncbi:hypothetical protein [Streptomyces sp. CB02261]|uniref:hypothetical protein n=1 Tax=Streptomyces sp. CB02261 TaxID=1703940 RepID=UPI000A558F7E|nr:hypothetical protein [Streptomyces sp. CB02261]